jgi:CheY-like chemotaxis protein
LQRVTAPVAEAPLLYVEDNENDVLFFRRALEQVPTPVPLAVVVDGAQAIDYLSGADPYGDRAVHPFPSVMLLDLKLPRKSGLDVLEWMKARGLQKPKVVVFTSSSESADVQAASRLGAFAYVLKPASLGLLRQIAKTLSGFCRNPESADAAILGWHVRPFV